MMMRNAGGEAEVFERLYRRYYARMLRFFVRVFRVSDAEAQELTQDSFTRLFRTMHEYRGEAEWALLETIARNVGLNRVRSLSTIRRGAVRPESLSDPDSRNDPAAVQVEPVDRLVQEERIARLRQEIARLPKGEQQCVRLFLEDYRYKEIAALLRISIDAVKSRIRDAKRRLRERLGEDVPLPEDES